MQAWLHARGAVQDLLTNYAGRALEKLFHAAGRLLGAMLLGCGLLGVAASVEEEVRNCGGKADPRSRKHLDQILILEDHTAGFHEFFVHQRAIAGSIFELVPGVAGPREKTSYQELHPRDPGVLEPRLCLVVSADRGLRGGQQDVRSRRRIRGLQHGCGLARRCCNWCFKHCRGLWLVIEVQWLCPRALEAGFRRRYNRRNRGGWRLCYACRCALSNRHNVSCARLIASRSVVGGSTSRLWLNRFCLRLARGRPGSSHKLDLRRRMGRT
mmetsp:Transcript_60305/g.168465  ORF Transcript_60305/g.168465 Transcript_60305/m.168465 type:complete len:269 (+) Transcript_60305:1032-1838(+)